MSQQTNLAKIEVSDPAELWDWLAANHDGPSVWLVTWKKAAHRNKYVSRDQVLDALIAYGWIDGRRMKLDDDRTMQLIAPRAEKIWARSYKERAERLLARGLMQPPGLAALEAAKASNTWSESDPIDDLIVPDDLRAALKDKAADTWFDAAAPSYRRNVLRYLVQAKRAQTRAKRIETIADYAAKGQRVPHY